MANQASTAPRAESADIVERALRASGSYSTRQASNAVFQHFTGVDPFTLPDILIRDTPIRSEVGARLLRSRLAELLGTRKADAGALLGASESRFSRNDALDKDILDRTHAILDTYMSVAATLGTAGATRWFNNPHHALADETPMALLTTAYGRQLVDDLINAALSGSYT